MRALLLLGVATAALTPAVAYGQDNSTRDKVPASDASGRDDDKRPDAQKDIVITATPFATDNDATASIVAKVDHKEILAKGGASIADSLADVPGIASSGFATGASRPIVRGMDATRVRILEDGVSSSDVSDIGPDHGVPIDPLSARSIEVVRGAATLRYGSQAIGGVVNAINNRIPSILPDKTIDAEATGSFDTVSDTGQGSLLADVKAGNLALHADGFYRDAGDYDTPLGTQANSFFRGNGESIGGSYFFGGSHIGAALTQYDAKYGIPSDTTYIDMKQTKVMTKSSFDLGTGVLKTLNIDGSWANYQHTENEPDGTVDTTFRNKEWDARAELLFGRMGPLDNTALGVEVQNRRFSALGQDSSYLFPTRTQSEAAFLFTELPVTDSLKLQASGRVETLDVRGTPRSDVFTKRNFTPVSGALSALFDATKSLRFGLTFSSTGRAPAITELFARGGHDGPNTFETGDPDLKIERANSIEGTMRLRAGRLRLDGSVYSTWFKNYIYGDLTGQMCDDDGVCALGGGGDLKELDYRQQGAHFWGAEGEASYQLIKTGEGGLEAKMLADYVRATLDDGNNVPRIPPYRIGGGLSWTSNPVDASFQLMYVGRQDKFGLFDSATPSYVSLDSQVAWRPFKSMPGIQFSIVGKNLTNEVQRDAAALNRDQVVMPGRNIRFVVRVATF
ncbi:MAG: TonB-dependent receptor [Sphingomonas sp.]|uniref:TonB-dependent receptor n=1 Tax=Sphingomonas sp. TaxID=28214 RepID=UPI003F7E1940